MSSWRALLGLCALALLPVALQGAAGFKQDYLNELQYVSGHATALAEAMPAARYGWRPGRGVRSVSEVYVDMAAGNYLLLDLLGIKPPADLYGGVTTMGDADMDKPLRFFGRDATVRAIFLRILVHLNEHTGQSVAYARMNGVTPQWSRSSE